MSRTPGKLYYCSLGGVVGRVSLLNTMVPRRIYQSQSVRLQDCSKRSESRELAQHIHDDCNHRESVASLLPIFFVYRQSVC